jgi:hypothetical protein
MYVGGSGTRFEMSEGEKRSEREPTRTTTTRCPTSTITITLLIIPDELLRPRFDMKE